MSALVPDEGATDSGIEGTDFCTGSGDCSKSVEVEAETNQVSTGRRDHSNGVDICTGSLKQVVEVERDEVNVQVSKAFVQCTASVICIYSTLLCVNLKK